MIAEKPLDRGNRYNLSGVWDCPPATRAAASILEKIVLIAGLFVPSLVTVVYFIGLSGSAAIWQQVAYAVGKGIQFLLPVAWRSSMPQNHAAPPPAALGIDLSVGLAIGITIATGLFVLYFGWFGAWMESIGASSAIREKFRLIGVSSPWAFIAVGLFYATIHSGLEEYYWRWFIFQGLRRHLSVPLAVGISCIAFAAHHVLVLGQFFGMAHPLTWLISTAVAAGGVIWAVQYHVTRRLAGCWLAHGIVDAAIFAVGFHIAYGGVS